MSSGHHILSAREYEPAAAGRCALAIMTKAPRAGEVKTRLTPPLTAVEAAALNVSFLRDMAAAILAAGSGARGIGCYTPADAAASYQEILPGEFQLIAQRGSNLGERLIFAAQDLFAVGFSSVCLIGSDSPAVPAATFAEAVRILSLPGDCLVLGPSEDGGYYLVGLKKMHRRIFEEISWSTGSVLEQTLERAAELTLRVHLLPLGYDVDNHVTLRRLCHELFGRNESREGITAPVTKEFLREILGRQGRERIGLDQPVA